MTETVDLTAATGLTKSAINGNFENKEAVALVAFDYNLALLREGQRAGIERDSPVREQLLTLPRFYRRAYPALHLRGGCPILNTAVETADGPPAALRQRVQDSLAAWRRSLARGQASRRAKCGP